MKDEFHGQGEYKWSDGKGKLIEVNGLEYQGEWKHGLMQGKGTYKWPDGRVNINSLFSQI